MLAMQKRIVANGGGAEANMPQRDQIFAGPPPPPKVALTKVVGRLVKTDDVGTTPGSGTEDDLDLRC